ncbi:antigen 5 like allergen Cul n 1 isoform X1 [Drosophila bipectinata]|uniref:antigen 5 like allergen Cul n 1 isoform X1 n=1 Tax=Drosophila bipectinata TaxID=42026 RepID=UPI001C8A532A|nr:antigen 5 like allergen Cul n 1 isoform X1 [Drosophila bipectinata]
MLDTMWPPLLLLMMGLVVGQLRAFDYCDPTLCPGPEKHIACNNFGELASTCSPDAHVVRITTARRIMILNELNEYRDRIARGDLMGFSSATRMATLQWDPELASFAELNVKRCALVNDHCRNSEQFRNVAQVVAEGGWQGAASTPDTVANHPDPHTTEEEYHTEDEVIKATLEQMFAEYKECSMRDIIAFSPPSSRILHLRISKCIAYFTQLVRDSTTHVGCGILRQTKNTTNESGQWVPSVHQYMTCNFVRSDDVNAPVYQSGDRPASDCRTGRNPVFLNLCSINEIYDTSSLPGFL